MRIYRMQATFGKLDHAELILEPGLNVITAPNEWGKSTWCAFLCAMFYGLDTRAKSTKTALADKERYAPWSGSPMAGRIDLNWDGRNITIERSTRGRVPMGVFRAYETDSGLEVPELTAANCGMVLLGVERSVFRRSAFLRQSDMPVTQDEALRRRLNDLVTTGDESGDADRLAEQLRELKNRCRYNRTGLIPQAENRCRELEQTLEEWQNLQEHCRKLKQRLEEGKAWIRALENHEKALAYAAAEADAYRVAQARELRDRAEEKLLALDADCSGLPAREETKRMAAELAEFSGQWNALQLEEARLPACPREPELPAPYRGMTRQAAENQLQADLAEFAECTRKGPWLTWILAAALLAAVSLSVLLQGIWWAGGSCLAAAALLLALGMRKKSRSRRIRDTLIHKYGTEQTERWCLPLKIYDEALEASGRDLREYRQRRTALEERRKQLQQQKQTLCGHREPEQALIFWQKAAKQWETRDAAFGEVLQAREHFQALQAMAKPLPGPAGEDHLTYPPEQTRNLLQEAREEQQRLTGRLGQYRGRMESLGDPDVLRAEWKQTSLRLTSLEKTYEALTLAQQTLQEARQELQRRFAPRIARRARELLQIMTHGRYQQLMLEGDLSLLCAAQGEDTLRDLLWRSDGTVDQLYVALRLAVAEALMPSAPLVLDDAFVRFDDRRLKAVLEILKQQSGEKQVILFTCQTRERDLLE